MIVFPAAAVGGTNEPLVPAEAGGIEDVAAPPVSGLGAGVGVGCGFGTRGATSYGRCGRGGRSFQIRSRREEETSATIGGDFACPQPSSASTVQPTAIEIASAPPMDS